MKIYLFSIIHAPKGDMFYRVIIEMNNADKSYLSVLKLTNSCTALNLVKIFSNPATEKLNLTFTASVADMPVQFVIVDGKKDDDAQRFFVLQPEPGRSSL